MIVEELMEFLQHQDSKAEVVAVFRGDPETGIMEGTFDNIGLHAIEIDDGDGCISPVVVIKLEDS
jgi:hypothetical protein